MARITTISAILLALASGQRALGEEATSSAMEQKSLPCVDVQIGQDEAPALDCMNQALRSQVAHTQGTPAVSAPLDARSSSNQIGTFNNQAAQQQMGSAYGHSAAPQRPKAVFVDPVLPPASR